VDALGELEHGQRPAADLLLDEVVFAEFLRLSTIIIITTIRYDNALDRQW